MNQLQKDVIYWCNYLLLSLPVVSFYFCNMLTIRKNGLINRWWKLAIAFSLLTVLCEPLRPHIYLHLLIVNCGIFLLLLYVFADSIKAKFLCMLSFYLISLSTDLLLVPIMYHLFGIPNVFTYAGEWYLDFEIYSMIAGGITNILFMVFFITIVAMKKIHSHQLQSKVLWIYIIIPVYQMIFFFIYLKTYQNPDITMIIMGILILFLDMLVNFIMIFSIDNLIEKIAVEENLSALYAQRQLELDYYQMAQKHMDDMRSLKHDFSNHLHTLHAMLEQGSERQDLSRFLDESRDSLQKNTLPRYCEHDIVNAVLTIKKDTASQSGIPMDISTRIPKDIPVSGIDLCSLFCNLLDNAIEACQTIKDQPRSIQIKTNVSGGFLVIKLENTYEKPPVKEHGFFRTSKENPEDHGYGMKLIERIIEKYHGQFTAEYSENTFTASAALDISNGARKDS